MKSITALIFTMMLTVTAQAETITAAQSEWSPFIKANGDNGLSVALLKAAMAKVGYDVDFKIVPWNRAVNEVKSGKIDILPAVWLTEERKQAFYFSEHYAENSIKFIMKRDDEFEYHGLASLEGKKVGIISGYGYGEEFSAATTFTRPEVNEFSANIKKLINGRIDLTLEDEIAAKSIIKEAGLDLNAVKFTHNALSVKNLYVAAGKANPKGQSIIDAYNIGLAEIKADGTYQKILNQYGIQ